MKYRMAYAALAAGVITAAACADRDGGQRLSTEPSGEAPVLKYVSSRTAAIVDPKTHRLEPVAADATRRGISASITAGSNDEPPLTVSNNAPGVARTGGTAIFKFTDDAKHQHAIVLLYRSGGGPPAAMQHYTDGALVSTSAYAWAKTSSGWIRTRSLLQSVRNGALVGTYTTTTVLPKPGSGGPAQMVMLDRKPVVSPLRKSVGAIAYGLAYAMGPQSAKAQLYQIYNCRIEWMRYVGASAVLAAAAVAVSAAPALTPFLVSAFISALATEGIFEDQLLDCIINHNGLVLDGSGAGGGASSGPMTWDCLEGSFAAHCTTPFTL